MVVRRKHSGARTVMYAPFLSEIRMRLGHLSLALLLCVGAASRAFADDEPPTPDPTGTWFLITEFRGQETESSLTISKAQDGTLSAAYTDSRDRTTRLEDFALTEGVITFSRKNGDRTIGFKATIKADALRGHHKLGEREIPVVGARGKAAFTALKERRRKANERGDDLEADYDKHARQVMPRDGFPVLFDPKLKSVEEAEGIRDDEPIIGIAIGDEAKAYPISIMGVHELATDTVGGQPIAASW